MNRQKAKYAPEYREAKPAPNPEEEGELMVIGGDRKGIPVRHEKREAKIHDHRGKREPKPDRKKMASLGVSYTVDRFFILLIR